MPRKRENASEANSSYCNSKKAQGLDNIKFIVKKRIGRQFGIQRNGDLKSQVVDLIEEMGYVAVEVLDRGPELGSNRQRTELWDKN